MEIRLKSTGQVMFESEFRAYLLANDGPTYDVLTPEVAEELGVDVVLEGPQAQPTRYQVAFRDGVEEIDGKWYTKYSIAQWKDIITDMDGTVLTAAQQEADHIARVDEEQAKSVRQERNTKLSACDWTQLTDAKVDSLAWANYRQQLRDLPAQEGFPWEVTWPTEPTA